MTLRLMVLLVVCLAAAFCQPPIDAVEIAQQNANGIELAERGEFALAQETLRRSYAKALRSSNQHLAAQAAGYLGTLYRFQGDPVRALPLLRFAKSQFAKGSVDAAAVSAQLGLALAQDGALGLAEQELRSAGDHPSVRLHLAIVLIQRGSLHEAKAILLELSGKTVGVDVASRAMRAATHLNLARLSAFRGSSADAERHFRAALDDYESLPLKNHPDAAEAEEEYRRFRRFGTAPYEKAFRKPK